MSFDIGSRLSFYAESGERPVPADTVEKLRFQNRQFFIYDLPLISYRRYEEVVQFR